MITNEVRFALRLYDDFDGALINDAGVRFEVNGVRMVPLRKKDGYYVFCGAVSLPAAVTIERAHYLPTTLTVYKEDESVPIEDVRLMRKAPGVWRDCVWLQASVLANTDVIALGEREVFRIHATAEEEGVPQITLAASTFAPLPGRRFCAAGDADDSFLVLRMAAPGRYECDRLPKAGTKGSYVRAFCSRSDDKGLALVPVEDGEARPKQIQYKREAKKWAQQSATVLP
jgi:hypothetical protein